MMRMNERGFSLVELLVAIAIFGLIAAAAGSLLSATLDSHNYGNARYGLYREGLMIMERMTGEVRRCTFLLIPNAHNTTRDILAMSGIYNDDGDNYFNDSLFPRIDEDPGFDVNGDLAVGINNIDDDGDGVVDEGGTGDDDEDGSFEEDPLDGLDNDGDGLVDEDLDNDASGDAEAGIQDMDDDGDGSVDEGHVKDDDEDGSFEEDPLNPIVYTFNSGTNTLTKSIPHIGQAVDLSTRVSAFQTTHEAPDRVLITLTLTGEDGEIVTFSERVYIENTYQRIGKRVR